MGIHYLRKLGCPGGWAGQPRRKADGGTNGRAEGFPDNGGELGTMIRNNVTGRTVDTDHFTHKQVCRSLDR